jgi:hypothetical protein
MYFGLKAQLNSAQHKQSDVLGKDFDNFIGALKGQFNKDYQLLKLPLQGADRWIHINTQGVAIGLN